VLGIKIKKSGMIRSSIVPPIALGHKPRDFLRLEASQ